MFLNRFQLNKLIANHKRLITSFVCCLQTNKNNQMIDSKRHLNKMIKREIHLFFGTNILKNKTFNSLKTLSKRKGFDVKTQCFNVF